jgi:para-aminobenzoate synthetase / 4-amino-4-deoxychorismate lyase
LYHTLPSSVYPMLRFKDNVILLETLKFDSNNYRSYMFVDPVEILEIFSPEKVPSLVQKIERLLHKGFFAAGFFGYECGYCFEQIASLSPSQGPCAHFGIYAPPIVFNHLTGKWESGNLELLDEPLREGIADSRCTVSDITLQMNEEDYSEKIDRIKSYIRAGDTYQINFTTKYRFEVDGSTLDLFNELKRKQPVSYAAYLKSGNRSILSLSPELFFRIEDDTITTKPMKGTVRRGKTNEEDQRLIQWLGNDPKNRSENVMIVDLLRNDIGRIADSGTVAVRDLFTIEKYDTLFQMTTKVEGRIRKSVTLFDLVRSIFPCGSVTGAPKIRSMQIIHELEQERRGVYTGAIGFFSPDRQAVFNVAIRTLVIDGKSGQMGVGSGIVYDSTPEDEYRECKLKADFLISPHKKIELLESLLWKDGYPFLEQHISRLQESATYFDFPCDTEAIHSQLLAYSQHFPNGSRWKIRLTLNISGNVSVESNEIVEDNAIRSVTIAKTRTNSNDRFLFHKTTNRDLYEKAYREAEENGFADCIFLNERDEITEGSRNNIFVMKNDVLFTPPVECGLLNGIYRKHIIATQPNVVVKILRPSDFYAADAIYICNAVRGMREVKLNSSLLKNIKE